MNANSLPLPVDNSIASRLHQLIAALRQDLAHFSQQLGCTEQLLADYLGHPTGANLDFLALVLAKIDGLRADWLLAGRGPMFAEGHPATYTAQAGNHGNTIGLNHGFVLNITHTECQQQLKMAMLLIEHQQQSLCDKDRIIRMLENYLPKP